MRYKIVFLALILISVNAESQTATPSCNIGDTVISATSVINHTVCVPLTGGGWEGQEYHSGSTGTPNNLIDYKEGGSKSEPVGTWSNDNDIFTYNYGGSVNYDTVFCKRADNTTYFINTSPRGPVDVVIKSGTGLMSCD